MSLKQEIETWVTALAAYDNNEFDTALQCFAQIADTSKILFNTGVIHATLGEHKQAVDCYQKAVQLDQYLAIAYFQQGVSNFLMGDFEEALANFNDTLLYLRGNNNIDYEQLGLKFKLYSCEVLFNRGLCYIYLQQKEAGMQDLMYAAREKVVMDHDVIEEAIREQAEGYTVFSIPVGVVYRPNEAKVKNLKTKDYLGKARLVAAQEHRNVDPRRQAALASLGVDDRPGEKLSYAALNLVKPDLRSRSRQQSEPPMHRTVFPPTPPPEPERLAERPFSSHSRRKSSESTSSNLSSLQQARPAAKPLRLELGAAAFEQPKPAVEKKPRSAPRRSESERPAVRREYTEQSSRSDRRRGSRYNNIPEIEIEEDPIKPYSQQDPTPQPQPRIRIRTSGRHQSHPGAIEEEEEEEDDTSGDNYPAETPLAFEIIPPNRPSYPRRSQQSTPRVHELRKIRIKVHAEDMRYVMTTPDVRYEDLCGQIRAKFSMTTGFKLKIRDEEGDMVTMADQDDYDMAVEACRTLAAKEKNDMGKMEMWVQEI
ncbi:Neutrophil cytosol factor 2 [Acrodontium crateriforme]|uniref:Neutrophil cytosol factor 2 n=1 Tax=Acrodontium crateriforme TaxID=150365 RepID=A0AAQ3RB75_9PEZI|nr:Neutrophil cytosol factor 2 [Acrodontium crateriforme]